MGSHAQVFEIAVTLPEFQAMFTADESNKGNLIFKSGTVDIIPVTEGTVRTDRTITIMFYVEACLYVTRWSVDEATRQCRSLVCQYVSLILYCLLQVAFMAGAYTSYEGLAQIEDESCTAASVDGDLTLDDATNV